ncbi:MAG: ribonuclease III family protein [Lewinella sp.]|uniref:ribonuclease III family protein n=1 Tax=Lewinella sp. TaxID=2004506 RepID=UPI003D6BBAD9
MLRVVTRLPKVLRGLPEPALRLGDGTEPAAEYDLEALQAAIGYTFADPGLLRVALTLGSWANEHTDAGWPSNACLEFFGDAVLDLVAADAVWRRFPELAEGELTRLRASLVAEASLVKVARALGLGQFLYMEKSRLVALSYLFNPQLDLVDEMCVIPALEIMNCKPRFILFCG